MKVLPNGRKITEDPIRPDKNDETIWKSRRANQSSSLL